MMDRWIFRIVIFYMSLFSVVAQSSCIQASTNTSWPTSTTASGSSTHEGNIVSGIERQYSASYAIDGQTDTFWNDDTEGEYPDILTISVPSVVTLGGFIVLSDEDGYLLAYTVETFYNLQWTTVSSITNSNNALRYITFPPVNATQVRINVTRDQVTSPGEFTRINEVYPIFASLTSSTPTSSPTPPALIVSIVPTHCPEAKKSNAGVIAGGVVGGVAAGIVIGALAALLLLRRRKKPVEVPPAKIIQGPDVHELDGRRLDPVGNVKSAPFPGPSKTAVYIDLYLTSCQRRWKPTPVEIDPNDAGRANPSVMKTSRAGRLVHEIP